MSDPKADRSSTWMVRAGRSGRWIDEFLTRSIVGLGWHGIGDSSAYPSKAKLLEAMRRAYPDRKEGTAASGASQLWRFQKELKIGDRVVTYDSSSRHYHLGIITSEAHYVPDEVEELTLRRNVDWSLGQVSRDSLSQDARNRLGSTLTLFRIPAPVAAELVCAASGKAKAAPIASETIEEASDPYEGVAEEAILRVADRIGLLDWYEMQRLVAALLRALGYRTEISPRGPDRGRDVFASPDGFGFQQPRIVVEVKHRPGEKVDAQTIRSFLGGRHKDDRGLIVSTGGFTKEALYEGDRATIPVKLMTLEELARAVIDNYEAFDSEGRALIPLTRIYWPV
jgi:restriction system protein